MPNYKSKGTYELLDSYEATGVAATITLSWPAIDFNNVSYLELIFDGSVTLNLGLEVIFNGDTGTDYVQDGRQIRGGTETLLDLSGLAHWILLPDEHIDAVDDTFFGTMKLGITKGGNKQNVHVLINSTANSGSFITAGKNTDDTITSISSITVTTSTSTWQVGTRMAVYKVKK